MLSLRELKTVFVLIQQCTGENTDLFGLTLELFMLGLCSVSEPDILAIQINLSCPTLDTSRGHKILTEKLADSWTKGGARIVYRAQGSPSLPPVSCQDLSELTFQLWDLGSQYSHLLNQLKPKPFHSQSSVLLLLATD